MEENKSDKYYCVFWYPTVFHRDREKKNGFKCDALDISDKSNNPHRTLSFILQGKDIVFTINDCGSGEFSFKFTEEEDSYNGFVIYSYERKVLDKYVSNDVIDTIFISCYHYAKTIYHEHEVHDESDARIKAYYYEEVDGNRKYLDTKPDISIRDNRVLDFFLNQYERLFCRYYAEDISRYYKNFKIRTADLQSVDRFRYIEKTDERIGRVYKYLSKQKEILDGDSFKSGKEYTPSVRRIRKLVDYIENKRGIVLYEQMYYIQKLCGNASTEYTYCKTLLESKYNKNHHHNVSFDDLEIEKIWRFRHGGERCDKKLIMKDCHRKMAFNIRNSIRYIEGVRAKCSEMGNELTQDVIKQNLKLLLMSDETNKICKRLAWLSVALALVSVFFGIIK